MVSLTSGKEMQIKILVSYTHILLSRRVYGGAYVCRSHLKQHYRGARSALTRMAQLVGCHHLH